MADPLVLKVGDLLPSVTVRLTDENDEPVDLTDHTVEFTLRSVVDPYTVVVDGGTCTFDPNQEDPANTGLVTYAWNTGDTDTAGDYLGSMVVSDGTHTQTYPALDYIRISIYAVDPPDMLPVFPGEIETAIGRAMTATETYRATQLIKQVYDMLSLWLRRDLRPVTYVEESHYVGPMGRIFLNHGPLRAITAVTVDGYAYDVTYLDPSMLLFPVGSLVKVTYSSGDSVVHPAVRAVITESVSRAILAGPQAATGALSSYSVEGTSVTFGPVSAANAQPGQVGRVVVADLNSVRRLKRRYAT